MRFIADCRADSVILYGCGIVGEEILGSHRGRVVNMHLGLSPYFRGSGTNFWPLAEGRPEGVGTTIHLAVAKVDAGPILRQIRPNPTETDRAHDLGTKAIVAGADALISALPAYLGGGLTPIPQDLSKGRVYRKRDFDDAAVLRLWHNLQAGMMAKYISEKPARDAAMPIVA
jgi:methionyl-tRNA formyltransferase